MQAHEACRRIQICRMGTEFGVNHHSIRLLVSPVQWFWKSGSLGAIGRHANACRASSCTQQGTSLPFKAGVGEHASCLGLRGRKHPSVSPGNTTVLVIARCAAGAFYSPTPHWFIPVWKKEDVFLQQRKNCISAPFWSTYRLRCEKWCWCRWLGGWHALSPF